MATTKQNNEKVKRVRQTNFTTMEEICLMQSVIDKYDDLFGSFKGSSRGQTLRAEAWASIAATVNA